MPIPLFGLGMFIGYPAPFQLFIFQRACRSCTHLPNTITKHDYLPAPARALRVGIHPIVGHADWYVNTNQVNNLSTEHAQTLGVIGRAPLGQTKRNLLTRRAIIVGAAVPRPFSVSDSERLMSLARCHTFNKRAFCDAKGL